jgi:hypothetical protein
MKTKNKKILSASATEIRIKRGQSFFSVQFQIQALGLVFFNTMKRLVDPSSMVHLVSSDAVELDVSESEAQHSNLLRLVLFHRDQFESSKVQLPIPGATLLRWAEFLKMEEKLGNKPAQRRRTEFQFPVGENVLSDLLCAVYSGTEPLVALCVRMILSNLQPGLCLADLPELAVNSLLLHASFAQLCELEDLELLSTDSEWKKRSPISLPSCLVGNWPDAAAACASRGDFDSLHRGRRATRLAIEPGQRVPDLQHVVFVSVTGEDVSSEWLTALDGLSSLRQLAIRLADRGKSKTKELILPKKVSSQLTHLELAHVQLSRDSPPLSNLDVFVAKCTIPGFCSSCLAHFFC